MSILDLDCDIIDTSVIKFVKIYYGNSEPFGVFYGVFGAALIELKIADAKSASVYELTIAKLHTIF